MSDNDEIIIPRRNKRPHNPISKKRITNKMKRQAGLEYVGFSMKKNKMKQDITKMARTLGPPSTYVAYFQHKTNFLLRVRCVFCLELL